jgi:hypothetical protein
VKLDVNGGDIRITDTFPSLALNGTTGGVVWNFIEISSGNLETRADDVMKVALTSSGNLGLGVTPSNASATTRTFEIGSSTTRTGNGLVQAPAASYIQLSSNTKYDASANPLYASTVPAASYHQYNGDHVWLTAPSGTAGNAISFSQAMTLDASGNLIVGGTAATNATTNRGNITLNGASSAILSVGTAGTERGYIYTQGTDFIANASTGNLSLQTSGANTILFSINGSERARITSSGDLLVGKTSASSAIAGGQINANGTVIGVRDGDVAAIFNRLTSDGDIISIRKSGTVVGSIGNNGGNLYIQGSTATGKMGLEFGGTALYPRDTGALTDGANDFGDATYRWRNLYLSGGVYLGGTAAANALDDYEEGTWTILVEGTSTSGSATYTTREGKYTKIGNLVYAKGYVVWTSGTGAGNLQISGLPFTSANDIGFHNTGTMYVQNVAWTGDYLTHFVVKNSTYIYLYGISNNGAAVQVPYDGAGEAQFMCVYRTA